MILKMRVGDFEEHQCYLVRVIFRNDAGDGPSSEHSMFTTFAPVPGIPTNFRFSSHRTANMVKLQWDKPDINPLFADRYEIELTPKKIWYLGSSWFH